MCVSSFPNRFPNYAWTAGYVSPRIHRSPNESQHVVTCLSPRDSGRRISMLTTCDWRQRNVMGHQSNGGYSSIRTFPSMQQLRSLPTLPPCAIADNYLRHLSDACFLCDRFAAQAPLHCLHPLRIPSSNLPIFWSHGFPMDVFSALQPGSRRRHYLFKRRPPPHPPPPPPRILQRIQSCRRSPI